MMLLEENPEQKVFTLEEASSRFSESDKVFSLEEAMNRPSPAMDKAEKRGFGEQVKYFLGEAIAKPLGSAIVRTPASFENILQVGFDQVRNIAQKQLNDDRAVFGISKEEFESRTPEQKQRIATNNKIVENMDRALDVSSRLQENWEYLSQSGGLELAPELHKGTFLENPSFTRALALGIQSVPVLGMAAAVTAFTKSPIIGAGLIGTMEAAEEYSISREKGVSAESAVGLFALNTVVMSALETVPLTGFMKGGSLPVRAFRGAIQEGAEEALQGVWRNSIAKIGYDETRVISEGIVEGFIAGFVSGGVIGSFSGSGDSIQKKIDNAREQGVDVDTMIDAVGKQVVENADAITETFLEKTSSEDFYKNQKIVKQEIPKFKNTEDAVNFGKTATPEQIAEMQSQRELLLKEIETIKSDDSDEAMQKGMDLAVEAQFLREAVEGSQGKIDLDKIKAKMGIVKKLITAEQAVKQGMSVEVWYHGGQKGIEGDIIGGMVTKDLVEAHKYAKEVDGDVYVIPNEAVQKAQAGDVDNDGQSLGSNYKNYGYIKPVKAGQKGWNAQLLSEYEKAKGAEVEGTGETKTRGLSLSVEEKAIEKGLVESLEGLPEYSKISMADQASKANELLIQDYEKAKRIAMGQEVPPSDILPESMFMAVKNKAIRDGDVMTIKDLAISSQLTTEATTMGQRISALADRDPTSPIKAIKEIAKAREKRVGAKKPQVKREVKNIKKHISQLNKAQNWEQFVRSLQC